MKKIKSILKEISFYKSQSILFILCIIFSIGTFISIDSLGMSVKDYVISDSKTLAGGDIIFTSNIPYSQNISQYFKELKNNSKIKLVNSYSFTTIVYSNYNNNSLLTQVRILDDGYPLYGKVKLNENFSFEEIFDENKIIVEKELLNSMNLTLGDELKIGNKTFIISAILISEPDTPINLFKLGPKILINSKNLNELNLIGKKSRINYKTLIKVEDEKLKKEIYEKIKVLKKEKEEVKYYNETNSTLEKFTLNFLFFIKLISIFIIFITGIGMSSTLTSLLLDLKESIGIKKILGEKSKKIFIYYLSFVILLSIIGYLFAIFFSYLLIKFFPNIFQKILPQDINIFISYISLLKGVIITLFLSIIFSLIPLLKTKEIKPISIFRKEEYDINKRLKFLIYLLITLFFTILIFTEIDDFKTSLYILIGSLITFSIIYLISYFFVYSLNKLKKKIKNLKIKLAINGLSRIGNKTVLIIFSLALSLTLIFTLTFIEINLQNNFIKSFPKDAPNLFLLDIPKDKIKEVENLFNEKINIYPIIIAPIIKVNNEDINEIAKKIKRGDPVTRDFSLTYSDKILDSEKLIKGESLFIKNWNKSIVQVSVLDEIAERLNLDTGDKITFLVQGVEIEAEIVSIRTRIERSINAFFYFTFEPKTLKNAPQTIFATTRINSSKIPQIQRELAEKFPQITVINGEKTAKTVGEIITTLSNIISIFTIFSLIGGILILISSIYATNLQRIKESVYYKLVGANKKFIRNIFLIEYFILGLISTLISIILSLLIALIISKYLLEIEFKLFIFNILIYSILSILTILLLGFISIYKSVNKKPIEYIRENNIE
jgi:putative ABC transport system permease protein